MLTKRVAIPSLIGIFLLGLSFCGAWYVLELQQQNTRNLNVNVANIRAAEELELIIHEMRHELDRYLLTLDASHLESVQQKQQQTNQWLKEITRLSTLVEEEDLIDEMQTGLNEFFKQITLALKSKPGPRSSKSIDFLEETLLSQNVLSASHQYLDISETKLSASDSANQSVAKTLSLAMILLGMLGALIGFGTAHAISRSMIQLAIPIRDVAGKLETVVGPLKVSVSPSLQDLQSVLETVSNRVGTVVDQLHDRRKEVIRVEQLAAVGKLGAGLAHELRNPLMCMKTLVQSARRDRSNAILDAEDLAVLDEEITRVDRLLQLFLDFAKPGKLEPKPVKLKSVVEQTLDLVSSRAENRNIEINRSIDADDDPVMGDSNQLRQVLLNLMLNAFDAVKDGGMIEVQLVSEVSPGVPTATDTNLPGNKRNQKWLHLVVADNGCGLPDERERLYEPFFSTKEFGIGLGLPISKQIVDEHGGMLIAEDREHGGAVFTVSLPTTTINKINV